MDEKEKELLEEEKSETSAEELNEQAADDAAAVAQLGDEPAQKVKNTRLRKALLRAGAALLAALILLAVTGRSLIDLKKGATATNAIQDEELGSFVKCQVFAFLGFYDAGADASGAAPRHPASRRPASWTSPRTPPDRRWRRCAAPSPPAWWTPAPGARPCSARWARG